MAATKGEWSERKKRRLGPPINGKPYEATDKIKSEIIRLLSEGATTREVCELFTMPSRATLFAWLAADTEFRAAYEEAKIACANVIVDEALDMAREAVDQGGALDHTRAKIAESFANVVMKYAEKVAPRQFGQLVKLGNADGDGPAVIQVVSYAAQASDKQANIGHRDGPAQGPRE